MNERIERKRGRVEERVCVRLSVCVYEKERERKGEREKGGERERERERKGEREGRLVVVSKDVWDVQKSLSTSLSFLVLKENSFVAFN